MEFFYKVAAWAWILMAFVAGLHGLRQSFTAEHAGRRSYWRAVRFFASLCFLLAATAIIASAIVKIAVRW